MASRKLARFKYKLILPVDAKSPTDSIYRRFDIVTQGRVLWWDGSSRNIYSTEPFKLRFISKGKQHTNSAKEIKQVS